MDGTYFPSAVYYEIFKNLLWSSLRDFNQVSIECFFLINLYQISSRNINSLEKERKKKKVLWVGLIKSPYFIYCNEIF